MKFLGKVFAWPLLGLVWLYRNAISPLLGMNCRFEPTCSAYAMEALHRYGGFKGGWLMLKRIGRCHPWGGSGYDPVPVAPVIHPERTIGTEHSSAPGSELCSGPKVLSESEIGSEPIVDDQRNLGTETRSVPGSEPGSDPKVLSESTIGSDPGAGGEG